jgi:hypothetical protein
MYPPLPLPHQNGLPMGARAETGYSGRPDAVPRPYPLHEESRAILHAPLEAAFARLDDHARLSAHMSRPSWRMGWSRMAVTTDEQGGHAVGSHIRLAGRILGIRLALDEVVVEREPPWRKVWETVGTPRLLVIGSYRMGFELSPVTPTPRVPDDAAEAAAGAEEPLTLRVFIEYELPDRGIPWLLGRLIGRWYARWCTRQMASGALAGRPRSPQPAEGVR